MNSLDKYIDEAVKFPKISNERAIELSKIILESNDNKLIEKAKIEFVSSNLLLVIKIAKNIYYNSVKKWQHVSVDLLDLISSGNLGLCKAVNSFDYKLGYTFSTYAFLIIKREINDYLRKYNLFISRPRRHFDILAFANQIKKQQSQKESNKDEDDLEEENILSSNFGSELLKRFKSAPMNNVMHLESLSCDDNDEDINWQDIIPQKEYNPPFYNISRSELIDLLSDCKKCLNEKERDILETVIYNIDSQTRSLIDKYHVSQQRINQILQVAFYKMRCCIMSKWNNQKLKHSKFTVKDFVIASQEFCPKSERKSYYLKNYKDKDIREFSRKSKEVFNYLLEKEIQKT